MKKILFSLVATLVCAAGSVQAADGISPNTLGQMGLSGLTVISDRDAMAIRGMGFCNGCGVQRIAPSATAVGTSLAAISATGCPDCVLTSSASSTNSYNAIGTYSASGTNYSEAGLTVTKAEIVDGVGALLTTTSTKIWAGGNSSAKAF